MDRSRNSELAENMLISIIIPVYNGEHCIRKAIKSVNQQDDGQQKSDSENAFKDVELLLIDDGSTDNSFQILQKYAQKYNNKHNNSVKVFKLNHAGVANVRNFGIEQATGDYITFIDQDDWIDQDFLQQYTTQLSELLEQTNVDVIIGGYKRVKEVQRNGKTNYYNQVANSFDRTFTPEWYKFKAVPAWAKLHNRKFLLKNNIKFFDNNIGEDIVFTLQENLLGQVHYLHYTGYNWLTSQTSTSATAHTGLKQNVQLFELLDEILKLRNFNQDSQNVVEFIAVKTALYYLFTSSRGVNGARFNELRQQIIDWSSSSLGKSVDEWGDNSLMKAPPKGEIITKYAYYMFKMLRNSAVNNFFTKVWCNKSSD